jgi:hypothetical protein
VCLHSSLCYCDWPTFFLWGDDMPIHGAAALVEVLQELPDSQAARVSVNTDDGFASCNYIPEGERQKVARIMRLNGIDPGHYPLLHLEQGDP